ncbi:MAG TPA: DUF502 domain-containing protein [Candidatus Binatia bacterium]|nr:DUF502 domain-containing protein [Candidatus Binatia bacterium]
MQRLKESLRRYFFAGLLVLLPLVITLWLLGWIISVMDGLLDVLPEAARPRTYLPIPGLGAIITLCLVVVLGFLATRAVTRRALAAWDGFLIRIPIFRGVYTSVQKLVENIFSQENGTRRVVLVEYPRKGMFTVGFATGYAAGELRRFSEERLVNVFVPTTPNPTAGFYLLVPERDVVTLQMTPEEAFKLIVSGGMISPEEKPALVASK